MTQYRNDYNPNPFYYVYSLVNPETNEPFYIGKGTRHRCYQHLKDTMETTKNKRLTGHIQKLRTRGIEPVVVKIKENMPEEDAYILEEHLIREYGRIGFEDGGVLMNILLDGRPPNGTGENNSFYGRSHSPETKAAIGDKNRGRKRSKETREKMSASHKGKPKSEEHRRRIGDAHRGRTIKEETKQKLREHNLKEEVREKNRRSKMQVWIVTRPDGVEEEVEDLTLYCEENGLLRSKMYSVASGARKTHKGFKCRKKYPDEGVDKGQEGC